MPDFTQLIEAERTRLNKIIDDLKAKRGDLDTQIANAQRELTAIAAYDKAKAPPKARTQKRTGGSRRQTIIDLLKSTPSNRSQLLDALKLKGDKKGEAATSAALAALKKQGTITVKDGVYSVA